MKVVWGSQYHLPFTYIYIYLYVYVMEQGSGGRGEGYTVPDRGGGIGVEGGKESNGETVTSFAKVSKKFSCQGWCVGGE